MTREFIQTDFNHPESLAENLFSGIPLSPTLDWNQISNLPVVESQIPTFDGINASFRREERKFLLPQTGMDLRRQVKMCIDFTTDQRSGGVTDKEIYKKIIGNNVEDLKRFCQEYVYTRLALEIPVEFGIIDNNVRLKAAKYSDSLYLDTIADKETHGFEEREGVVKESVKKVEDFLVKAKPGSMAIFTSPPGWSGLEDDDGIALKHPDTQTYVYAISEYGELKAITLRTDCDLEQNETLIESLSKGQIKFDRTLDEKTRIKNVVSSTVFLEGSAEEPRKHLEIVDALMQVKGTQNAFETKVEKDGTVKTPRPFTELINAVKNLKSISNLPQNAERKIEHYLLNALNQERDLTPENFKEMTIELGKTVLEIFDSVAVKNSSTIQPIRIPNDRRVDILEDQMGRIAYQDVLAELQKVGGCAGGACEIKNGLSKQTIISSGLISPRVSVMSQPENQAFDTFCPMCNTVVKAVRNGNTLQCLNNKSHKKTFD